MFKDWRLDARDVGDRCFDIDRKLFKFHRLVKKEKDAVEAYFREHYTEVKTMYDYFRAVGGHLYSISAYEFRMLARIMNLTDLTKKKYTSEAREQIMDDHDFDRHFQATKVISHEDVDIILARTKH